MVRRRKRGAPRKIGDTDMAYKNQIEAWRVVELTDAERESVREMLEHAFKRAGGKGTPTAIATREILKGKVSFDAALFPVAKVAPVVKPTAKVEAPALPELSAADRETVSEWVEALKGGAYTLDAVEEALADYADVLAVVKAEWEATMKARAVPKPVKAAPKPGAKLGAAHGVAVTAKGKGKVKVA